MAKVPVPVMALSAGSARASMMVSVAPSLIAIPFTAVQVLPSGMIVSFAITILPSIVLSSDCSPNETQ